MRPRARGPTHYSMTPSLACCERGEIPTRFQRDSNEIPTRFQRDSNEIPTRFLAPSVLLHAEDFLHARSLPPAVAPDLASGGWAEGWVEGWAFPSLLRHWSQKAGQKAGRSHPCCATRVRRLGVRIPSAALVSEGWAEGWAFDSLLCQSWRRAPSLLPSLINPYFEFNPNLRQRWRRGICVSRRSRASGGPAHRIHRRIRAGLG